MQLALVAQLHIAALLENLLPEEAHNDTQSKPSRCR
jgi:hypothetical protein